MRLGDVFSTSEARKALDDFCAQQIAIAHASLETAPDMDTVHAAQAEIKVLKTLSAKVRAQHEEKRHAKAA